MTSPQLFMLIVWFHIDGWFILSLFFVEMKMNKKTTKRGLCCHLRNRKRKILIELRRRAEDEGKPSWKSIKISSYSSRCSLSLTTMEEVVDVLLLSYNDILYVLCLQNSDLA